MDDKKQILWGILKKYAVILVGSVLYSIGISLFLDPNNLAPGGVSGLSIILGYLFDIPIGTLFLMLNIPLIILGAWKLGLKLMISTVITTFVISGITNVFSEMPPLTTDLLLAGAFGGAFVAVGMALVIKSGATTGGSDIIVLVLKEKIKHLKIATLFLMVDCSVVLLSIIVFRNINLGLYAIISMVVFTKVFDTVLYGSDSAKLIYVISDNHEPIAARILNELGIGFTYVKAIGPYRGTDKNIILCAVKKQLYPKVRDVITQEDPSAFLIVSWASDIYGEGFKNIHTKEL